MLQQGGPEKRKLAVEKTALFREAYARKQRFARRDSLKSEFLENWKLKQQVKEILEELVKTISDEYEQSSSTDAVERKFQSH